MNWFKFIKTASMDVYIDGFVYPRVLDSVLQVCFGLSSEIDKNYKTLIPKEDMERFQIVRYPEMFTPDGETDAFGTSGIINFYTLGFSKPTIDNICKLIRSYLTQNSIRFNSFQYEQIGTKRLREQTNRIEETEDEENEEDRDWQKESRIRDKKKAEYLKQMNGSEIRVVRIPIVHVSQDRTKMDLPPEINMSNVNAQYIFGQVLKYSGDVPMGADPVEMSGMTLFSGPRSFNDINAQELIKRINYYLGEKHLKGRDKLDAHIYNPEEGEEWKGFSAPQGKSFINDEDIDENTDIGPRVIDYGIDDSYIRERLGQIKQLAEWAVSHGYSTISVT